jgi:hypothetical protein
VKGGETTFFDDQGAFYDTRYTVLAIDAAGNRSKHSEPAQAQSVD